MGTQHRFRGLVLVSAAFVMAGMTASVYAQGKKAPDAVLTDIKNVDKGAVIRRAGGRGPQGATAATGLAGEWQKVRLLESLYEGDQLAVEGGAEATVFAFGKEGEGKKTIKINQSTASKDKPFAIGPAQAAGTRAEKLVKALKNASESLGRERTEMASLSTRAIAGSVQGPILVSPRNTKIAAPNPVLEWAGEDNPPVRMMLEVDGKEVANAQFKPGERKIEYPSGLCPLQEGKTCIVSLKAEGMAPDQTRFTYQPLSPDDTKALQEFEAALPPEGDVSRDVLRAVDAMDRGYYEEARTILAKALKDHPDSSSARALLVQVYVEQSNLKMAQALEEKK